MEDFTKLFSSHFTDESRSLSNTLAGVVDHAVRLRGGLPADGPLKEALDQAYTDTEALSERAQLVQQQLGLGLGTQKQAATATEEALALALERIRKNEGTLRGDSLVEDPAERQRVYALLYPGGGVSYYTRAALGREMADRLDEYLTRAETQEQLLGLPFVKRVQDELGPFRTTRETQVAAQSKTEDYRTDRRELVAAINEQCDHNYHLLSAHFRLDLSRPAHYWNSAYYLRAAPRAGAGEVLNLAIQAHQHRQVWDLDAHPTATQLHLSLRDGGPVLLARVKKTTSPLPASTLRLAVGTPLAVALSAVPGTGPHLLAYNETGKVTHLDGQLS